MAGTVATAIRRAASDLHGPARGTSPRATSARRGRRAAAILLAATLCRAVAGRAEETEREIRCRPLGIASHADAVGLLVGRVMVEKRWNELLDEMMYAIAPRGAWDARHPAWLPARRALAKAMQRASAVRLEKETSESVHAVVLDHYLDDLTDEERARATAFFESPGGKVWLASRERFLEERTYGLPFRDEADSRAEHQRRAATARKALLHLPAEQTAYVYEFNDSPLGNKLLKSQNGIVADILGNVLRSDLDAVALEQRAAIAAEVRARVPGVPPPSEKTYLGTVTMAADRTLDVTIEQFDLFRRAGSYELHYAPDALHWRDVAAGVPGIAPGETRNLYRDPRGRLGDRP